MSNEPKTPPPYEEELQIASLAVQRASILTKAVQAEADKGSTSKPDASPVTIADFAAQAILTYAIHHHFPGDKFVAEESASSLRGDPVLAQRVWGLVSKHTGCETLVATPGSLDEMLYAIDAGGKGEGAENQRTWFLDPIDGTATFIRGQQYAVSVALVEDGEQKMGVVGYPNLAFESTSIREEVVDNNGYGMMLSAVKGQGAYKRRIAHSGLQPPERNLLRPWRRMEERIIFTESSVSLVNNREKHKLIRDMMLANPVVDLFSMQVKYAALAIGACNAMVRLPNDKDHRFPAWDHAGGMLIFEESGGKITDLYGRPFNYACGRRLTSNEGLVAAKSGLHLDLLRYSHHIYEMDK
ncbi:hypothetical protein BDV29DRAFT_200075 [Aspergillus leporis]|jgi:3'(2'), 5'-bisphosphate nucleotidase|uniref:3'(2'),5'-bisphosphate nucleotidase n=1 Tax=Aspergillus leporis TaxID=41062 RepID=A0A5N5WHD7_9EURO|nr:hypothetical protein BDV29DRAFT_200075 [Aspergillus leporis]